jgi:anti-sigma factor RsiW
VTDHREMGQDLVELALGEVAEPRRSELLSHLSDCRSCRAAYADMVAAVDATVPAAPQAQPPAGFDVRVLAELGIDTPARSGPVARVGRLATPGRLLTAAALLVAVAAGVWAGATVVDGADDARVPVAEGTAMLWTGDGRQVGTAAVAWMHESRVLVVQVSDAPVGVQYSCRVLRAGGEPRVLGRWEASSPDGGTWVVSAPPGDLDRLQLVTASGQVWSSARLP